MSEDTSNVPRDPVRYEEYFLKMRENEEQKKEDNPFDENDNEIQPFYHGRVILKGRQKS